MKPERWNLAAIIIVLGTSAPAQAGLDSPAVPKLRLSDVAHPSAYSAELIVVPERSNFVGKITIDLTLSQQTSFVWLHGHGLTVTDAHLEQHDHQISARPIEMEARDIAEELNGLNACPGTSRKDVDVFRAHARDLIGAGRIAGEQRGGETPRRL